MAVPYSQEHSLTESTHTIANWLSNLQDILRSLQSCPQSWMKNCHYANGIERVHHLLFNKRQITHACT